MSLNKKMWKLSCVELIQLVRSTKIVILGIFAIFVNIQILTPLRELSREMGEKISILEPFAAIGNSGAVVLILPLFFITMMADFPREGESRYFCQIRSSKREWVMGQVLYAAESSVLLTLFTLVISMLLALDFIHLDSDYSDAVTHYVATFPEKAGAYVVELIPENLYNQMALPLAVLHTMLLLMSYFFLLALVLLVCSLLKKKTIGILLDGLLILLGTITCAGRMSYMWIFPMAHTITWLHYAEYESRAVLPLGWSYLYFFVINAGLMIGAFCAGRRYNEI